jgi:hypothetical protein
MGWGVNRLAMVDVRVESIEDAMGVGNDENTVSDSLSYQIRS